jgi:AcrR family transcriptional regulator
MASPSSPVLDRRQTRRRETVDEALDHAVAIMTERGVGALTISEVARRMGVRGPSLYKYFPSLHAVYDQLFARGAAAHNAEMAAAMEPQEPGLERIKAQAEASLRWSLANPALGQLMFWRPVPGFEPSPSSFAISSEGLGRLRAELAAAAALGQLTRAADSNDAARMLTVVISGLFTRQSANQPGVGYEDGLFSRLADDAFDMFLARYTTTESATTGSA